VSEPIFDERIAAIDASADSGMHAPEVVSATVAFLTELAGDGPVLEFGIGTGRIAIPFRARGVDVTGIDISPHMIAKLRERPGGQDTDVTIGDIATANVGSAFSLVYAIWNTFINLMTQDEQVDCFHNAARHLQPGGYFVTDTMSPLPDLRRLPPGEKVRAFSIEADSFGFDEFDVIEQHITSHHYWTENGHLETWSSPCRYVWPSELDLMGQIAGLTLRERWADWNRAPLTDESSQAISVWHKPESENVEASTAQGYEGQ
jgi:SAM-dependent methyltransferase